MSFESEILLSLHGVMSGFFLFGSAVCLVALRGALSDYLQETKKQQ